MRCTAKVALVTVKVALVTVTRVESEVYVAPMPGAIVTRATGKQREQAV